ncbi:MAG: sel1 repeat family protein [Bacteroidales bacterium]|nr:sel1 repeat family protein [Candidatus Scybalousia scybalohippi]
MKKVLVLCLATIVALHSFAQKGQEEFEKGISFYQEENYTKAVSWFKKAAEQGHADAQYNLAFCYANGNGVSQDYKQAASWYEKAAEQGLGEAIEALKK